MKYLKWILICGTGLLVGCSPKLNDGITPTQPSYTNAGYPNPLVLYNGYLATNLTLNVYEYSPVGLTNAAATITAADTSVIPQSGKANLVDVLANYEATTWVGFPILTTGPINLTNGNFSELTFYTQGVFYTPPGSLPVTTGIISFNGLGVAMTPITVTTSWQAVTFSLSGGLSGPVSTEMFVANFYANTINAPVTAYYDQIELH